MGISFMLYINGYTSPFMQLVGNMNDEEGTPFFDSFIGSIQSIFTNSEFLVLIGVAAVVSLVGSGIGGGMVGFAFPLTMLLIIVNMVFLPTTFILDSALPQEIKLFISLILNGLLMLAIIDFIRGGDA